MTIYKMALALAVALGLAAAQSATTVILVRHAERASSSMSDTDMGLSPAGLKRAAQLDRALADAKVQAIYTSTLPRTIQTAQPLAKRLNLKPKQMDDVAQLAAELKSRAGQTILVVHHSNTLPRIMEALGVTHPPAIADTQFDWIFVVTLDRSQGAHLLALHYSDQP